MASASRYVRAHSVNFSAAFLQLLMPRCDAETWNAPLAGAMSEFDIVPVARMAAFLAQLAHESVELTHTQENLNYSASLLLKTFPRYFDLTTSEAFARQPQRIANHVYANRLGNGDEASGDGWEFRGRGPIQLTGKSNYEAAGSALGLDLVGNPDAILAPTVGARVAGWFWASHRLNELADSGDFVQITRTINGGLLGLAERRAYFDHAMALLRSSPTEA